MIKKFFFALSALAVSACLSAAVNTGIRLNSLGFRTDSQKKASISASCTTFNLKSASDNSIVFTGTATSFGVNPDTGENIWIADFSSFTAAGTYYLYVPGVGQSYNFVINDNAYDQAFIEVFKGFYLWRCGTAVTETYNGTTYSHAACHLDDAYLTYVGGDPSYATQQAAGTTRAITINT